MSHPVPIKPSDRRRVKAFRLPLSYLQDVIVGYQGNADTFNIVRMSKELLPPDFTIVGVWFEYPRNDAYIMISHPSFPEHSSGDKVEAVPFTFDEIEVRRTDALSFDPVRELLGDAAMSAATKLRDEGLKEHAEGKSLTNLAESSKEQVERPNSGEERHGQDSGLKTGDEGSNPSSATEALFWGPLPPLPKRQAISTENPADLAKRLLERARAKGVKI